MKKTPALSVLDLSPVSPGKSARDALLATVDLARQHGVKAGLFRPISLWPFPSRALVDAARCAKQTMVVELSTGQMVEDVRLALNGRIPVEFFGRMGGNVPSAEECHAELFAHMQVLV